MQAFPDMYGNPYSQQMNPYAMQPMNQFGGPSFNQMGGYGPTFANMTGYGNFGGAYQQPQMPQRYSNDYNRFLQSGQSFNEPVMGYNSYGQIFAPPRQQPPSFGKGGGGFRPQPPAFGGKGGGMGYAPQPPVMGGKGQPQNQGPFMSYPGGSGYTNRRQRPERRTRQLGLNNEPSRPAPPDVQVTPPPPQVTGGVPQEYAYPTQEVGRLGGPGPTLPNLDDYFGPGKGSVASPPVGGFNQPAAATGTYSPTGGASSVALAGLQASPVTSGIGAGEGSPVRPIMFDNEAFQNFRFGDGFGQLRFQEGGEIPNPAQNMEMMLSEAGPANPQAEMSGEYDRLIQMTMQAVLGQVEQPDEIIQMFIDEFGVDAFRQLRDAVLKQQVPNAQTEGMVDGNGGGMDDQVMGMIGAQRPVAVSPGEYIIPADVVSGLGDGSSKSGADILDELSQAVRMTRTGTTEQPRPLMETLSQ
jgi:hypothetical protein